MIKRTSQRLEGLAFLTPFMLFYSLFLIYPLFNGLWISLHDWNLLKVALNPEAKEFVGLKNYVRVLWGRDMEWSATQRPLWQGLSLGAAICAVLVARRPYSGRTTYLFLAFVCTLLAFVLGWAPGEDGRLYNRRFWPAVSNTVVMVGLIVPLVVAISLTLAVVLNRETRWALALRTVFFVSSVLSVTVVTLIWKLMLSPNLGLVAELLTRFGFEPISWLTTQGYATAAVVMATVWWGIGISMMLFLAALQEISSEIYDAAKVDDIGPVRTFFSITLPNITHAIVLVGVLGVIAHFQIFGQVKLLTDGGPVKSTESLVFLIYGTGFRDNNLGRATAMATALLVIISIFSVLQLLLIRRQRA